MSLFLMAQGFWKVHQQIIQLTIQKCFNNSPDILDWNFAFLVCKTLKLAILKKEFGLVLLYYISNLGSKGKYFPGRKLLQNIIE